MESKLYIHENDGIHTIGICLESDDVELKQKFLDYIFDNVLNNKDVKKKFSPFFQSGYDSYPDILRNKYYYIEMLSFYKTEMSTEDQNEFLNLMLDLGNHLGLQVD